MSSDPVGPHPVEVCSSCGKPLEGIHMCGNTFVAEGDSIEIEPTPNAPAPPPGEVERIAALLTEWGPSHVLNERGNLLDLVHWLLSHGLTVARDAPKLTEAESVEAHAIYVRLCDQGDPYALVRTIEHFLVASRQAEP